MPRIHSLVFSLLLAVALTSCGGSSDPAPTLTETSSLPVVAIAYDDGVIRAEVASTAEQRATGLGHRTELDDDAGMLFDLGGVRVASFWMKDTLIPLDMIWIDEDRRVAGIAANVQPEPGVADGDLRSYSSGVPVRYVVELNAGAAAARGIAVGDELRW